LLCGLKLVQSTAVACLGIYTRRQEGVRQRGVTEILERKSRGRYVI
jgi:hypothetical protein